MSNQRAERRSRQHDVERLVQQAMQSPPRPQMPREIEVDLQIDDGPNATPISVAVPLPGGRIKVLGFGGLYKNELLAAPIAAILSLRLHSASAEEVCDKALDMAGVLLARAAARRAPEAPQEAQPPAEATTEPSPILLP